MSANEDTAVHAGEERASIRERLSLVEDALAGRNGHVPTWAVVQGASLLVAAVLVATLLGPSDVPYRLFTGLLSVSVGFAGIVPILSRLNGGDSA